MSARDVGIFLLGFVVGFLIPVVVVLRMCFPAFVTWRHWREFAADFWHVWRARRGSP